MGWTWKETAIELSAVKRGDTLTFWGTPCVVKPYFRLLLISSSSDVNASGWGVLGTLWRVTSLSLQAIPPMCTCSHDLDRIYLGPQHSHGRRGLQPLSMAPLLWSLVHVSVFLSLSVFGVGWMAAVCTVSPYLALSIDSETFRETTYNETSVIIGQLI